MPCLTTAISGKFGKVEGVYGTLEVKAFTLNLYLNVVDATSWSCNNFKEILLGMRGGTGTMTAVGWMFPLYGSYGVVFKTRTTGGMRVTGTIVVKNSNIVCEVDSLVTYDCEFEFCGQMTFDTT